ncbi:MAG: Flp pilus assembly protein CpaB [Rhizobiales bacterium]|nr:Flp pilus assembly protein CpaB [Hyphomicrobiales bacterium]
MKIARVVVLAVAVGAAGGAAMLAKGILVREPERPQIVQQAPSIEMGRVLVAAVDIALGHVVTRADLRWQDWPEEAVAEIFITSDGRPRAVDDIAGSIARTSLSAGEPINELKLVRSDRGGFMSAILPSGMRAISTRISPETGAGGFILPNDRVDVLLTKNTEQDGLGSGENFTSETILRNVRVLAIDQTIQEEDGNQVVVGKTATLELGPSQSEILALAEQVGELSLALRSLADSNTDGNEPETVSDRRGSVRVMRFGVSTQTTASR